MKPKTKYDCPKFTPRGGHCNVLGYTNPVTGAIHKVGCKYPKDISKCPYLKGYIEQQNKLYL